MTCPALGFVVRVVRVIKRRFEGELRDKSTGDLLYLVLSLLCHHKSAGKQLTIHVRASFALLLLTSRRKTRTANALSDVENVQV